MLAWVMSSGAFWAMRFFREGRNFPCALHSRSVTKPENNYVLNLSILQFPIYKSHEFGLCYMLLILPLLDLFGKNFIALVIQHLKP